jgi:hypothetical protein
MGILFFFGIPGFLVMIDFTNYMITGKRLYLKIINQILELLVIIAIPLLYLIVLDFGMKNDCCSDSASFSPEHRLSIYGLIVICVIAFFYNSYRLQIAPPIPEILVNCILIIGVILNIFIGIQVLQPLWVIGNIPPILLFIIALLENQRKIIYAIKNEEVIPENAFEKIFWQILGLKLIYKVPILLLLSLPVLFMITCFFMLLGQKPDSLISAFTQTYKHGLSKLDYLCENVDCGGHFLCSVAANGHKGLVKPQRLGTRSSKPIICNRQLLIANAFEELIERNLPNFHRLIRNCYNKVGDLVHKHYIIFNNKLVADLIYLLMKPLEWIFLISLYTFDKKPESKIAIQYLSKTDRKIIDEKMKKAKNFISVSVYVS